jgi:hypothetical protein
MEDEIKKDMQASEEPAAGSMGAVPATPEARAGQETVSAEVVTISGKADVVNAQTVNINGGRVRMLRGDTVKADVKNGGVGAVIGNTADVDVADGGVGFVGAKQATVKSQAIGFVMAWNLKIEGDAKIGFDMRAGLVAGIAIGLVMAALRLLQGRRRSQAQI